MAWIPLALLAILVIVALAIAVAFSIVHLILTLAVAGFVGWLADLVVPGQLPYGWLGAVVAGLVGGWLGLALIGHVGPSLLGVPLVPSFVGATALAVAAEVIGPRLARRR